MKKTPGFTKDYKIKENEMNDYFPIKVAHKLDIKPPNSYSGISWSFFSSILYLNEAHFLISMNYFKITDDGEIEKSDHFKVLSDLNYKIMKINKERLAYYKTIREKNTFNSEEVETIKKKDEIWFRDISTAIECVRKNYMIDWKTRNKYPKLDLERKVSNDIKDMKTFNYNGTHNGTLDRAYNLRRDINSHCLNLLKIKDYRLSEFQTKIAIVSLFVSIPSSLILLINFIVWLFK